MLLYHVFVHLNPVVLRTTFLHYYSLQDSTLASLNILKLIQDHQLQKYILYPVSPLYTSFGAALAGRSKLSLLVISLLNIIGAGVFPVMECGEEQ